MSTPFLSIRFKAEDWSYANWMYQHDPHYRELIEQERREREEQERQAEAYEAELDARNPLMTRFTKRVIEALDKRAREVFALSVERRKEEDTREANRLYWKARDIADTRSYYEHRLEHYQGISFLPLCKTQQQFFDTRRSH